MVQRGSCSFAVKAENAQAAGAIAVVIFNEGQPGRTDLLTTGTLGSPDFSVPVVSVSFAVGAELYALRNSGLTLHVAADNRL